MGDCKHPYFHVRGILYRLRLECAVCKARLLAVASDVVNEAVKVLALFQTTLAAMASSTTTAMDDRLAKQCSAIRNQLHDVLDMADGKQPDA